MQVLKHHHVLMRLMGLADNQWKFGEPSRQIFSATLRVQGNQDLVQDVNVVVVKELKLALVNLMVLFCKDKLDAMTT